MCSLFDSLSKELDEYEMNPEQYVKQDHKWFTSEEAEKYRSQMKRQWDILFLMNTKYKNS